MLFLVLGPSRQQECRCRSGKSNLFTAGNAFIQSYPVYTPPTVKYNRKVLFVKHYFCNHFILNLQYFFVLCNPQTKSLSFFVKHYHYTHVFSQYELPWKDCQSLNTETFTQCQ